jgi:restriction endonuclease S subunit
MAQKSAIAILIEKAEAEIAFQQRLIESLRATQKAKDKVKPTRRTKTTAADVAE